MSPIKYESGCLYIDPGAYLPSTYFTNTKYLLYLRNVRDTYPLHNPYLHTYLCDYDWNDYVRSTYLRIRGYITISVVTSHLFTYVIHHITGLVGGI